MKASREHQDIGIFKSAAHCIAPRNLAIGWQGMIGLLLEMPGINFTRHGEQLRIVAHVKRFLLFPFVFFGILHMRIATIFVFAHPFQMHETIQVSASQQRGERTPRPNLRTRAQNYPCGSLFEGRWMAPRGSQKKTIEPDNM